MAATLADELRDALAPAEAEPEAAAGGGEKVATPKRQPRTKTPKAGVPAESE